MPKTIEELQKQLDDMTPATPEQKKQYADAKSKLANMRLAESKDEYIKVLQGIAKGKGYPISEEKVDDPLEEIKKLQAEDTGGEIEAYSVKSQKIIDLKNQVRAELGLDPLPYSTVTAKQIDRLQSIDAVSDFLKVKSNKHLKERVHTYLDEKAAIERFKNDRVTFKQLIFDEREQLKERPVQFIKTVDKLGKVNISINPNYQKWEKSFDTLDRKVSNKIKSIQSRYQDSKMSDGDKSYLANLEKFKKSLDKMQSQSTQLEVE
jgi:hypothetical protein